MNCLRPCRSWTGCRVCPGGLWATVVTAAMPSRQHIWHAGARPAIPAKRNEEAVACPEWIYNNRNVVERLWARLKEWRAVATPYEKTAHSFMGVLCLAATLDWIKR